MSFQLAHVNSLISYPVTVISGSASLTEIWREHWEELSALVLIGIGLVLIGTWLSKQRVIEERLKIFRGRASASKDWLGLVLRFGLGVYLLQSGLSDRWLLGWGEGGNASDLVAGIEIILGLGVLFGALLSPMLIGVVIFELISMLLVPSQFGQIESLGIAIALLLLRQNRPGIDDLFAINWKFNWNLATLKSEFESWTALALRLGAGLSLLYMGLADKLLNLPMAMNVVVGSGLTRYPPYDAGIWIVGAGFLEVILGVLLIIGLKTRGTATVGLLGLALGTIYFKEILSFHLPLAVALIGIIILGAGVKSLDQHYGKG